MPSALRIKGLSHQNEVEQEVASRNGKEPLADKCGREQLAFGMNGRAEHNERKGYLGPRREKKRG